MNRSFPLPLFLDDKFFSEVIAKLSGLVIQQQGEHAVLAKV